MSHNHLLTAAFVLFAATFALPAQAQKRFTRDAVVVFDATAPNSPENIKAINKSGTCVWDVSSGAVEMAVLLKGFLFEQSLMQEHFNENYMESSKYPKAIFSGKLDNPGSVNTGKDGTYKVNATGTLTMHGISKPVSAPVTFTVKNSKVSAIVNFAVALADYGITIPSLVADKVNTKANVNITTNLELMK